MTRLRGNHAPALYCSVRSLPYAARGHGDYGRTSDWRLLSHVRKHRRGLSLGALAVGGHVLQRRESTTKYLKETYTWQAEYKTWKAVSMTSVA
eukprot:5004469-Pleurochrysis_carterae.AAC.8